MVRNEGLVQAATAVGELFERRIADGVAPGSVFAVFDRDGLVHSGGFGRGDDSGAPPTCDTAFRIASCTKSFTAAALLRLRDRGALSLADPIDRYVELGPLMLDGESREAPTLGMLASMSGGLPSDDPWADRQESLTRAEFDRLTAAGARLVSVPGTAYEYSNLGFALLGRAIEVASGRSYLDVVMSEVVEPLGLAGIGFDRTVTAPDGVANGYLRRDGGWLRLPFSEPGAFSPIGGVFATARSLAGWGSWLASAFDTATAEAGPLSAASRREMQQGHRLVPAREMRDGRPVRACGYGYGLVVELDAELGTIVSHSGGYPGFSSHMRWHPESGLGVVGFENATYSGAVVPVSAALDRVLQEVWRRPPVESSLWPETLSARAGVESLLAEWDPALAEALFADNVDLDEPLGRRRARITELSEAAGIRRSSGPGAGPGTEEGAARPGPMLRPLSDCDAESDSPAQLAWTVQGPAGSLRCAISLSPQLPPRVQTLDVRALTGEPA